MICILIGKMSEGKGKGKKRSKIQQEDVRMMYMRMIEREEKTQRSDSR